MRSALRRAASSPSPTPRRGWSRRCGRRWRGALDSLPRRGYPLLRAGNWATGTALGLLPSRSPPRRAPMTDPGSGAAPRHVSVMPAEVLRHLDPQPGQVIVDATVGAGGHAALIAARLGESGRLIGLDQDDAMLALARPRMASLPVTLVHARFDRLPRVLEE